jgi:glycopeptide antibiotics resistance protein
MPSAPTRRYSHQDRIALLVSLGIILPLGYSIRFAQGPAPAWLHDALGSIAYEIFWILLAVLCFPNASVQNLAIGVCLLTCGIEFLQLWQPPFLQAIRATLPGRLVLGNTFSWTDFPAYLIGSYLGWIWVNRLRQLSH